MAGKKAEIKALLTLNNVAFLRGIKQASEAAKRFAVQFAKNPFQASFYAGAVAAQKSARLIADSAKTAFKISAAGATVAGAAMATFAAKSVGAAAEMESLTGSMEVLLGSSGAAKKRMGELAKFAKETPFSLPEVVEASRTLQVFTEGALSTGRGLEMVGDIASATNRDFQETAVTVGRLFAALRSGTHAGEALASLQEAGAITPNDRRNIESQAGTNGAKAWETARLALGRFHGQMERQSHTWLGLVSNFKDSIRQAMAAFGTPLMASLKPTLELMTRFTENASPEIAKAGEKFADGVKTAIAQLEGFFLDPSNSLEAFGHGLRGVMLSAVEAMDEQMQKNLRKTLGGLASGAITDPTGLRATTKALIGKEYGPGYSRESGFYGWAGGSAPGGTSSSGAEFAAMQTSAAKARARAAAFTGGVMARPDLPVSSQMEPPHRTVASLFERLRVKSLSTGGLKTTGLAGTDPNFFNSGRSASFVPSPFASTSRLNDGAHRTVGSLLSVRERRRMERGTRAAIMGENFLKTGKFSSPDGVIHSGDTRAAKAYVRNKQREEGTLKETNTLLKVLTDKFDRAFN